LYTRAEESRLTFFIRLHKSIVDVFIFIVLLDLGMAETPVEFNEAKFDLMPVIEVRVDERGGIDAEGENIDAYLSGRKIGW